MTTHRLRRRGIVPLAFAVLLTVAAGLALAEEHAWEDASAPVAEPAGVIPSSSASSKGVHPAKSQPGVGSRALMGHDGAEPAADERSN